MIDAAAAKQIIEQYNKHGWALRRVLFSSALSPQVEQLVRGVPAIASVMDAFWFARRSQPGREAWELRRLSGSPFAIVQVIDDGTEPDEFDAVLSAVEQRMLTAGRGPLSH
jgi:hypothetical protein